MMSSCLFTVIALTLAAGADASVSVLIAQSDELVVKVADPVVAADALVATVEELGGYFASRADAAVTLKVPALQRKALLEKAKAMGVVVQEAHQARDLTQQLEEWRTLLASRRGVFARYEAVLKEASAEAVVTVEREMTALVQAIEQLEGQLRMAEHQLEYAQVVVRFEFRDRTPPTNDGKSSFVWLNGLNLADLLQEFARAQ